MPSETGPIEYKNFKIEVSEQEGRHVATVKPLAGPVLGAGFTMGQSMDLGPQKTPEEAVAEAKSWIDSGAVWPVAPPRE
jgi:hypothetical protein